MGVALIFIVTVSEDGVHGKLEIVHTKTEEVPAVNPVTPDVGLPGAVIVPVPENFVHTPVPTEGVLPASVAVVTLQSV